MLLGQPGPVRLSGVSLMLSTWLGVRFPLVVFLGKGVCLAQGECDWGEQDA